MEIIEPMKTLITVALAAAVAFPLLAPAQTLPQSTQDRQEIATLTYQANLPGTSAADRLAIQRRITQLQYQINTRPLVQPMPTLAPSWSGQVGSLSQLPQLNPNAPPVPLTPTIYGSCDGDRSVIAYLDEQLKLATTTRQERNYALAQRAELERDLRSRGCERRRGGCDTVGPASITRCSCTLRAFPVTPAPAARIRNAKIPCVKGHRVDSRHAAC
jgi:hypothetical protein